MKRLSKRRSARKASPKRRSVRKTSPKRRSARKASPKRRSARKASPKRRSARKASPKRRRRMIGGGIGLNPSIAKKIIGESDKSNLDNLCDQLFKGTEYEQQYQQMKHRKDKDPKVAEYEVMNLCKNSALAAVGQKSPTETKKRFSFFRK